MSHSLEHKVVIFRTLPGALHRCKAGQLISISHSVTPPAQLSERTTMAQDTGATRGSVCVCVSVLVSGQTLIFLHGLVHSLWRPFIQRADSTLLPSLPSSLQQCVQLRQFRDFTQLS